MPPSAAAVLGMGTCNCTVLYRTVPSGGMWACLNPWRRDHKVMTTVMLARGSPSTASRLCFCSRENEGDRELCAGDPHTVTCHSCLFTR